MDPKFAAILTIAVVGIISFLIGWLLTDSKWKKKFNETNDKNRLLFSENGHLNDELKKAQNAEKNSTQTLRTLRDRVNEAESSKDRLTTQKALLENKYKVLEQKSRPEEVDRLLEELGKEKRKRVELQAELNDLKIASEKATTNLSTNGQSEDDQPSIKYRLTNIFQRIGLKDTNNPDNLTDINGIGPEISKKLNGLGIYNFLQISRLTVKDLATIDEALESFPGRGVRDNWIGQATQLYRNKYQR